MDYFDFICEEHEKFLNSLTFEEIEKYNKDMALIKLKPFLQSWILKHFGSEYLKIKKEKEKKRRELLDFYYAFLE